MEYYVEVDGAWVVVNKPENGQRYRAADAAGGSLESVWVDPQPELPDLRITRLAFLERFTDAEAIQIDLASQGATVEAATVRRFMSKVNAATFIDLSRPDTVGGVNALVDYGFLTQQRADEIITAPIQSIERPQ